MVNAINMQFEITWKSVECQVTVYRDALHSNLIVPNIFVLKTMKFANTKMKYKGKMGYKSNLV